MNLPHLFYIQNLDIVVLEMICLFLFWTTLMVVLKDRARRIVGVAAAVLSLTAILLMTVYKRSSDENAVISLIPFISFVNAREQVEIYRSLLMNVCLFLPLGLSLPFALPQKQKPKVMITLGCALFLSVAIEGIQLAFRLGHCETDDVIMNVLGALVGTLSYMIFGKIQGFKNKHRHRHIERP